MCSTSSTPQGMFDVQNIYGTPQVPRKKPCMRPRRMTLIDLRNVPLTEEDAPQRKASAGTIRSEGGLSHFSKSGIWHIHDSTDNLQSLHRSSMRTKHTSGSSQDGSSRFPKLEECAHFHYDFVDFGPLQVALCDDDRENYRHNEDEPGEIIVLVRVSCNKKAWTVRRTLSHFATLDRQLHRCIFDRKFSQLPELQVSSMDVKNSQEVEQLFQNYLRRFSELAGTMINCGSILNWLEMDNRGNHLLAVDDSGINTPAIAAAHAVKRYTAQAADEISLQVGDIVSVIDMPPPEDTIWWRGKRGFEVGFFPGECVEVIGDKVPPSMATCMPATGSLSSSPGSTLTPSSTPAAARKPCEIDNAEDLASMMRKHGKLLSFLRTFFSTRPPRNQLKQSGIVKERVFGCDLGEHLLNSGHDVPLVLKSCTEVIERHGIVDGIYRLSGITSNIQKLRLAFDEDQVPELMESTYLQDIHSISSLLKMYFRELPNPLLTYQLYDKFAEAVKDEDNKLLRIHDVVQQLPPPHYRTLEYLMRHLGRVASQSFETGMHSKNLAIVWAPNLLRSKELELGGGAAALQGVGIQAVVTECLICYCDLIFNDKMPSYNSPHLHKSQKKPRPKSLAISTPTRLLSLEEARERAFIGSLAHSQRFIDVGGGPSSLPSTYHTIIDLPGYRKKSNRDVNKGKKSPVSGWKSIFSKPRGGSVKKTRKGSMQDEEKSLSSLQAKALTEEDVHNWKRRLRSAKSAESLLSMATSARSSVSSQASSSMSHADGRQREDFLASYHKRSLSSDASAIIHHYHHTSPHLESVSSPTRQTPCDDYTDRTSSPGSHRSRIDKQADSTNRQSFVRGDSTRKALHRRTPSAPNTPRLDHDRNANTISNQQKSSSQPRLDSMPGSPNSDSSLLMSPTDTSLGIDIDAAIKARLQQMALQSGGARSSNSSPRSPEETSPGSSKGQREKRKVVVDDGIVEFQSSPILLHRTEVSSPLEASKFFVSRYHDYAEIVSDDEGGQEMSAPSSATDMQELVEKLDSKLSTASKCYRRNGEETSEPEAKLAKLQTEKVTHILKRPVEHIPASMVSSEIPPSTQVVRRKADWIPSESVLTAEQGGTTGSDVEFPELTPRLARARDATLPPIPQNRNRQTAQPKLSPSKHGSMSKCLSIPSDIARSLENITASQNDLLSSVTLSELSQSINSFCASAQDDCPPREDLRWRRSTSLDSLETESTLCRTLRSINAQMDSTFHAKVDRAIKLEEEGYSRHGENDSLTLTPLHISEDNLATPTAMRETHFPATSNTAVSIENQQHSDAQPNVQYTIPRSGSVSKHREAVNVSRSQSCPVSGNSFTNPDYAVVTKRQVVSKGDRCFRIQPDDPDYAVIVKGNAHSGVVMEQHPSDLLSFTSERLPGKALPTGASSDRQPNVLQDVQWAQGGEGHLVPIHSLGMAGIEMKVREDMPKSDTDFSRTDSNMSSSHNNTSLSESNVSNSDFRHQSQSEYEVSSGVCVVRRQRHSSTSSSGSSSSNEGDNSDDSIEIVHHAQPVDTQFAMKLSSKQRAAESMPPQNSSQCRESQSVDVLAPSNSSVVPGDLRQFSSDDVLWRQSPLFNKALEIVDGKQEDFRNTENPELRTERGSTEPQNSQLTQISHRSSGSSSSFSHFQTGNVDYSAYQHAVVSPDFKGSQTTQWYKDVPENNTVPLSPRHKRRQHRLQLDSTVSFENEDILISSGRMQTFQTLGEGHASTPACQQSHIPSSRSPTISNPLPSQQSCLPSPHSPTIFHNSGSQQSHMPCPRSPPSSSQSRKYPTASKAGDDPSVSVPLHLMLYHPDEFQVPPASVGLAAGSLLPQVHVKSDTVTEEKTVIRKESGRLTSETQKELPQQTWHRVPIEADVLQGHVPQQGMHLGRAEQDSMEVDNLCNRLVDELHAVGNQPASLNINEGSLSPTAARGSFQVEAVMERRTEETEVGDEEVVEQRLLRVESFGDVQDEEVENALNAGKEMLLAHSPSSAISVTHISSTATVLSDSSQPLSQTQVRPTHERRPSASKIPRFHKRTNSREEKSVISDASQGDVVQSSITCFSTVSCTSENNRNGSSVKSKEVSNEQNKTSRVSKIPLSQKAPSPTSSFREPKLSKSVTSPSSPKPTPASINKSASQSKVQPSPAPRTRTSIHKSDHVAPPADEVVEIARPSVKKRTSISQKGDRNAIASLTKDSKGEKNVIVQELKIDKGDAKLVIEKQSSLKKKIQTVHARKVPHPPRLIAEALDTDTCDSPPAELSSTGPSDMEHSSMSSQEDEVFSDESLRFGAGRDRSYSSGMGRKYQRSMQQSPSPSALLQQGSETYLQMAASRSSLDDSVLQLAAERHEDLIPHWENSDGGSYSTGSLRTRRSLKMQNLLEVFERGPQSNSSEGSGDIKVKDRSDSTSGSTTISVGSQDREPDTDDDIFQPCCPRLPSTTVARRSRSRERAYHAGNQSSAHRRPSQSPTTGRYLLAKGEDAVLRRRRPSPFSRSSAEECPRPSNKTEGGVGFGRPPRYRSASRGRTYSDSSTSESDNTQHFDVNRAAVDSLSRPRGLPHGRTGRHEEAVSSREKEGSCGEGLGGLEEQREGVQRRGSIKELRQLFEKNPKDEDRDSGSELSPSMPVRRSIRTRSVSPAAENSSTSAISSIMRRSLEIPNSSMLKQRENTLTSQPLRLGPKPFYGSKK